MTAYHHFTIGLPSTCHDCGAPVTAATGGWYAVDFDTAQSGGGKCANCAGIIDITPPKPTTPADPNAITETAYVGSTRKRKAN